MCVCLCVILSESADSCSHCTWWYYGESGMLIIFLSIACLLSFMRFPSWNNGSKSCTAALINLIPPLTSPPFFIHRLSSSAVLHSRHSSYQTHNLLSRNKPPPTPHTDTHSPGLSASTRKRSIQSAALNNKRWRSVSGSVLTPRWVKEKKSSVRQLVETHVTY